MLSGGKASEAMVAVLFVSPSFVIRRKGSSKSGVNWYWPSGLGVGLTDAPNCFISLKQVELD